MIQGFTFVFFNSQIDGDLEEKITENDGKMCAVVYALLGKTEKDVNNCRKASSLASLPGKLIAFIVDEILTSGRVAFPSVACENSEFNPDGDSFFYEECLHKNRGKFTEELNAKCTKYAKEKLKKLISK